MIDFKYDKNGKERMALCCDCGYAVKTNKMFIKQYKNTGICLCRKCALKLSKEITNTFENQNLICKVGDIIYHVYNFLNEIISEELIVISINFDEKGLYQIYGKAKNGSIFSFTRNYNLDEICFTLEEVSKKMMTDRT